MKKTLLFLSLSATLAMAKSSVTVMPYSAYINYSGSTKESAAIVGLYASLYNFPNKFELGLENTNIKYNNDSPDLDQNDFTAIYTRFIAKNYSFKIGIHSIQSDDTLTDNGLIGIVGMSYYKYLKYNFGFDLYYSKYKNYSPKELKVTQISPYAGFNFGDYTSKWGSFYLKAQYNYIKPQSAASFTLKKSYNSFELTMTQYKGKFTTTIGAWVGKKAFAVANGGFTVYNLGETYKGGAKAAISYSLRKNTKFSLKYNYAKFTEAQKDAHTDTFALSLSHTW